MILSFNLKKETIHIQLKYPSIFFSLSKYSNLHYFNGALQPVEFCSDLFLLPLGLPPVDMIDLMTNTYIRNSDPVPPTPPPRPLPNESNNPKGDSTYYDILVNNLEFNNNAFVSEVMSKSTVTNLSTIYESRETEQDL